MSSAKRSRTNKQQVSAIAVIVVIYIFFSFAFIFKIHLGNGAVDNTGGYPVDFDKISSSSLTVEEGDRIDNVSNNNLEIIDNNEEDNDENEKGRDVNDHQRSNQQEEDDDEDGGSDNAATSDNTTRVSRATGNTRNDRPLRFALITFSHLSNATQFESTILEAMNTWVPSDSTYFVVLNTKWREVFDQWKKKQRQQQKALEAVVDRIQPIYVDCPEAKWGESPCCKQQKGLVEFHKTYNTVEKNYDWIVYMDDDVYLQVNVLEAYIRTLPIKMPDLKKYTNQNGDPMLITGSVPMRLGRAGYSRPPQAGYRCSRDEDFKYPWGQPAIYNQAALKMIIPGLELNGLVQQCLEYDVTHDVGNAIFHWMYSIPGTRIRSVNFKGDKPQWGFREDTIVYHGAGSSPKIPMTLFHEERTKHIEVPFAAPIQYFGRFHPNGFQRTKTFQDFGSPKDWKVWHTMPVTDCIG